MLCIRYNSIKKNCKESEVYKTCRVKISRWCLKLIYVSFKTFDGKICAVGGQRSLQCDISCSTPF